MQQQQNRMKKKQQSKTRKKKRGQKGKLTGPDTLMIMWLDEAELAVGSRVVLLGSSCQLSGTIPLGLYSFSL